MVLRLVHEPDVIAGSLRVHKLIKALLMIPTTFAQEGAITKEDLLISQAVNQNVKANMTQPLSVIGWVSLIQHTCPWKLGSSAAATRDIQNAVDRVTSKYDSHRDVQSFELGPAVKRQRKGRKKAAEAQQADHILEDRLGRVTLRSKKRKALKAMFGGASEGTYELFKTH